MPFDYEEDPGTLPAKGPQGGLKGGNDSKASERKLFGRRRSLTVALTSVVQEEKKKNKKKTKPSSSDPLEVKDTAGDCAVTESWNGRTVLNTADRTLKVFSNGAWQSVHSGW